MKKAFVQNYNWGPELEIIRNHRLLFAFREFVVENCPVALEQSNLFTDENSSSFTLNQKFSAILELSRAELFENCKSRNYVAYKTSTILENDRITIQALKHEYRSYLSECVVLYERLAYLLAFLELCYCSESIDFEDEKHYLHVFFNPLIFDFRNDNSHHRYVVRPKYLEVENLETKIHNQSYQGELSAQLLEDYLQKISVLIDEDLDWFEYTSREFAQFFQNFFDSLANKVLVNNKVQIPSSLPVDLKLDKKITPNFRRKVNHKNLFNGYHSKPET
ncbi:hypothetical protein RUX70_004136 [Vibrio vulnificus]|nr:hypothetical protein [Vibrio vulnificus]ELK2283845.1 hypothetical protein [Vibrio vulnificus]